MSSLLNTSSGLLNFRVPITSVSRDYISAFIFTLYTVKLKKEPENQNEADIQSVKREVSSFLTEQCK